jgi:hypothetical protein
MQLRAIDMVSENSMKFPLLVCSNNTLKLLTLDVLAIVGKLDSEAGTFEMNVTSDGRTGLKWILDANGLYYELVLVGLLPLGIMQRIGLKRAREGFQIIPGRRISMRELTQHISELRDQFEEAPNVADLKVFLGTLAPDHLLGAEEMSEYLGE